MQVPCFQIAISENDHEFKAPATVLIVCIKWSLQSSQFLGNKEFSKSSIVWSIVGDFANLQMAFKYILDFREVFAWDCCLLKTYLSFHLLSHTVLFVYVH